MNKLYLSLTAILLSEAVCMAQVDTSGIYGNRADSLDATVFTGSQGPRLNRFFSGKVESISQSGLQKMACCNLADSFENSASVTVGYSDATTGARQIRLLGLSGIYTQMLDENRPVMRGLSSPFGLSYVPGPWLSGIQIAKGASSVINGAESVTGTINLEHRKPTDEIPLFINLSTMADTKTDINAASSLQFGEHWNTVMLAHASGNFKTMDSNSDGFVDDPKQKLFTFANRWLWYSPDLQVRFGIKAISDSRDGGQLDSSESDPWTTGIRNKSLNAYFKVGIPFSEDGGTSLAVIGDFMTQKMDARFGRTGYVPSENSYFLNLIYQREVSEKHKFSAGASTTVDRLTELSGGISQASTLGNGGIYGEYTFTDGDRLSIIAALRAEGYTGNGLKAIPRLTLKWSPVEAFVFRANGGRGLRYSLPLIDNIGVFSTGKAWYGDYKSHILEDAWTAGASATLYFPFLSSYISADWFGTRFKEQLNVEYMEDRILFSSLDDGQSYTNSLQGDFHIEPVKRFTIDATFRYTDARVTFADGLLHERPMTSRFKAVLNMQYALPLNRWIFDFTVSANGPCRKWDFMGGGLTPTYPLLYAQVTRRFKGFDIYAGGENLTGFTQKQVVLGTPWTFDFDASQVWGPVMGAKVYAGLRITIWKTE